MPYKIIISDDHPLFRNALIQTITNNFPDVNLLETSGIMALDNVLLKNGDADLLILDLHMPGVNSFERLLAINQKYSQLPIIMISADEDPSIPSLSEKYGAMGFIPKSSTIPQINEALISVLAGFKWFPENIENLPIKLDTIDSLITKVSSLTAKQSQVYNLVIEGLLNKEIAYRMKITEATVKAHLTAIMQKIGVSNRTKVVLIANKINIKQFNQELS